MRNRSAGVAALLSFVFPGLGHAYLGNRRQAMVFALPAAIVAAAVLLELLSGADSILASVITPSGSMTMLILFVLSGVWRALAMVDSVVLARRRGGIGPGVVALSAALLVAILAMHGAAAYVSYAVYDAGSRIFVGAGADDLGGTGAVGSTDGSALPGSMASRAPQATDDFQATPATTPQTAESRINILLTGNDSAESRTSGLTDTLLVVSIDPRDHSVVMLSLPRTIANFPLYDGRTFKGRINSLMTRARNHPDEFPDGPLPTVIKEVGYLVGVPIHYYAAIDLQGFRRLIDEVGGVTVNNPRAIDDPDYDWLDGTRGFTLPAGEVHLDGRTALAYVRSRQGDGAGDYTRASRQQQLLVALRAELTTPSVLTRLPQIVEAAGDTVRTNLPTSRLEEFLALARSIDTGSIQQVVLSPPYSTHPPTSETDGEWQLRLDMDRLAELSIKLFGDDSRYAK